MSTWRQDVADALTPIEGFNDVKAVLNFNIHVIDDPFSEFPLTGGIVRISRTVQVKGLKEVDARLVDGKNFMSEDFLTEISFNNYLNARKPLESDQPILNNGVLKTLEDMRPMTENYGISAVIDTLTVAGKEWRIADVAAFGIMNDDSTGEPVPSKLRFTLRG